MADDPHNSFRDLKYGIGQNDDGTFNIFPKSELAAKTAERDMAEQAAAYAIKQSEAGFPPDEDTDATSEDNG